MSTRFQLKMKSFAGYLVAIVCVISLTLKSQGFRARFSFVSSAAHISKSIVEVNPGNYITTGIVVDTLNGFYYNRLCVMGIGPQGQQLWVKTYGNSKFEYLNMYVSRSIYKRDNYLYHACQARDSNNVYKGVLLKIALNGDTVWQRTFTDAVDGVGMQMVTGSVDGGFLITGYFDSTTYTHLMLIKTDANGNELWRQKIAKTNPDTQDGKAIFQDTLSKKIVVAGYQLMGAGFDNYENIVILDSLGVFQSRHAYAGTRSHLLDLIQTIDKKFVAVGMAIISLNASGDPLTKSYIVKFDVNNPSVPIWKKTNIDYLSLVNTFSSLSEWPNGDLLVGGYYDTCMITGAQPRYLTRFMRFDSNGNVVWKRYYNYKTWPGGENVQTLMSCNVTSDNGWVGAIQDHNYPGIKPLFYVKYDSTGCDTTAAYCQMIAMGIGKNYQKNFQIDVYPNPTQNVLNIKTDVDLTDCLVTISDISGRQIKVLLAKEFEENRTINLNDVCNGVYILTVSKNKETIYTAKIIKEE